MKKRIKKQTTGKTTNQYTFDPRQDEAWKNFIDKESNTFGNAYGSALKAGYARTTAQHITLEDWWLEKARRSTLLSKAEKVIDEDLQMETVVPVIGMFGPVVDKKTGVAVTKIDADLRRIRQGTAHFVAERLGKKKGYSTRTEITGEDGAPLPIPILGSTIAKKDENQRTNKEI